MSPKKKKKFSKTMVPERISSLKEITEILSNRYFGELPDMAVFLAIKQSDSSFFIFQEIRSFPIESFVYSELNNSLSISASWHGEGAIPYFNGGKVLEITKMKAPRYVEPFDIPISTGEISLNIALNNIGNYNKGWLYHQLDHLNKIKATSQIRIENINRIYLYKDYFEIFSDEMCLLGLCHNNQFPYSYISPPNHNNDNSEHYYIYQIVGKKFSIEGKKAIDKNTFVYYWEDNKFLETKNISNDVEHELETGYKPIKFKDVGQNFRQIDIDD